MQPLILMTDDGSTVSDPLKFQPEAVPDSAHVEVYDVNRHWNRIGYFLCLRDGQLIIDGMGIKSHVVLAKTCYFLQNHRQWDEAAFVAFNATVAFGGIWPPILILMASRSYPNGVAVEELREIIHRFAPSGDLAFRTNEIFFDFGKLSERVATEVRRVAVE